MSLVLVPSQIPKRPGEESQFPILRLQGSASCDPDLLGDPMAAILVLVSH